MFTQTRGPHTPHPVSAQAPLTPRRHRLTLGLSYIHQNHAPTESWLKADGDRRVNRSSSKGNRLIILHAITKDGPLGQVDATMTWAGHTPHPTEGKYDETAEVLWVAQSNSGDYHKNMFESEFRQVHGMGGIPVGADV